jgi:acyl-CoA thioesterase-1
VRFVALGDSYTIGTSVGSAERWPDQLVKVLREEAAGRGATAPLELVGNPAVNGYTTRDVIRDELPQLESLKPEIVSLLIGTNDVIQGVGPSEYVRNLATILDAVIAEVGEGRVFGVTTPDYTVTPAGADYGDPTARARTIGDYNTLFAATLARRGIAVVDIHDISLRAAADRSLVAADGLHPSGRQYGMWVERIAPVVSRILEESVPR